MLDVSQDVEMIHWAPDLWVAIWQWAVAFHNKISHVRAYLVNFPDIWYYWLLSDMLLQKPKAVSLESPAVWGLFHINKVDFPAHYWLREELARTMREAEAETESWSLISPRPFAPHSFVGAPSWLFIICLLAASELQTFRAWPNYCSLLEIFIPSGSLTWRSQTGKLSSYQHWLDWSKSGNAA